MDVTGITGGSRISITDFVKEQGRPAQGTDPDQYVSTIFNKAQKQGISCTETDVKNALKAAFGDPQPPTKTEGNNVNLKS